MGIWIHLGFSATLEEDSCVREPSSLATLFWLPPATIGHVNFCPKGGNLSGWCRTPINWNVVLMVYDSGALNAPGFAISS